MKKSLVLLFLGIGFFLGTRNVFANTINTAFLEGNLPFSVQLFDDDIVGGSDVTRDDDNNDNNTAGVTVTGAYCSNPNFKKPFKILGRIFSVIKIIIPIIILAFGVVDFFKAVIGSKDDEIKKSTKSLIMRLIAGVCIFFLPAIIHFVFRLIDDWNGYESDYSECSLCITEPNKC